MLDGEHIETTRADFLMDFLIEKPCTVVLHAAQQASSPKMKLMPRLKIAETQGDLVLKNHLIRIFDTFEGIYQNMGGKKRKRLLLEATFLFAIAPTEVEMDAVIKRLFENTEFEPPWHQRAAREYGHQVFAAVCRDRKFLSNTCALERHFNFGECALLTDGF